MFSRFQEKVHLFPRRIPHGDLVPDPFPEYVRAFVEGMEFVLLAAEGRVHGSKGKLHPESENVLRGFLEEYRELIERLRSQPPSPPPLSFLGNVGLN